MVRTASAQAPNSTPEWHTLFLGMLPAIRQHARICFRHLAPEAREEVIQEVICNACCALARLAELNKLDIAYPGPLARFAVAQVRDNRRVGCRLNIKDVMSQYCQARKHVTVERLDKYDDNEGCWLEAVVEDPHTPVFEQVQFRCDFPDWLASLSRRDRRIAQALSMGHTTGHVARKFKVSDGRVSQLRRELAESWRKFVGDEPTPVAA
jgi:hypothetical protein